MSDAISKAIEALETVLGCGSVTDQIWIDDCRDAIAALKAEQTAPAARVPDGYCNAYELLGWAHAEFCTMLDAGEDPRQAEVGAIAERMERAMLSAPQPPEQEPGQ